MSQVAITVIVLVLFLAILVGISSFASKSNIATPNDFFLANRGLGTVVMVMTTGASYFSTWTLLGSIGTHYRDGVWFSAFAAWAVVHALFIWLVGSRIWYLGRKHDFVTPGDMMEKYYKSPFLRILFAIVGMIGLIPYMLIQITGGAFSLNSLTNNAIPYWVGILIMGIFVGVIVTLSGGRGAAWGDTFMGFFFGITLLIITFIFIKSAGGLHAFTNLQSVAPEILVNKGQFPGILETALGLTFGFWIMPHMWQKFYSASSPMTLAKTSLFAPFWNSWLMALGALFIGMFAHTPGLIPGLSVENSDTIIPVFFSTYAPFFGAIVVAAVVAAAISTINSTLLTTASLLVNDIYVRFINKDVSPERITFMGKLTVLLMTVIVVIFAFIPVAQGFIVPVAALGYGIVLQLVPAAIGPLFWRKGTLAGAASSIIIGETALTIIYIFGSPFPFGPATTGLILGSISFFVVSILTTDRHEEEKKDHHRELVETLFPDESNRKDVKRWRKSSDLKWQLSKQVQK
ncbi:sodium:solute symporter family protein [Sporosarcina sp. ACRSM]|uniref:sodium:solute symporter family protein n=1 Tax=Sporosarcina sp. ACRSM TaxID=2918216 RepID=UPI001EF5369C|nr:sodium:solute symporter family protein [Sporosarcina sp. ACRSM]MCG7337438.1 sodium:solute symporter family protein [Sporosarcina sp. ACRSM]